MNIFHYSGQEIKSFIPYEDIEDEQEYYNRVIGKPYGLWVSIEDDEGEGWKDWCLTNEYLLDNLEYKYRIKLKIEAKIIVLDTVDKILDF